MSEPNAKKLKTDKTSAAPALIMATSLDDNEAAQKVDSTIATTQQAPESGGNETIQFLLKSLGYDSLEI